MEKMEEFKDTLKEEITKFNEASSLDQSNQKASYSFLYIIGL